MRLDAETLRLLGWSSVAESTTLTIAAEHLTDGKAPALQVRRVKAATAPLKPKKFDGRHRRNWRHRRAVESTVAAGNGPNSAKRHKDGHHGG